MQDTRQTLSPELTQQLTDFARACKAAARAVSLYPGAHPAIGITLGKLVDVTAQATGAGPFSLQIQPGRILIDGAAPGRPDPSIAELADILHRQLVGSLVLHGGADVQTWRALLLLLARTPEENRGEGGIARLWGRSGGPSIEIHEIDYAEVLREREGEQAIMEDVIAACLKDVPRLELNDDTMKALLGIVRDPEKLRELVKKLEDATAGEGRAAHAAAFLKLLKGLSEYVARAHPEQLEGVLRTMADAAGQLSADAMVSLLAQRMTADAQAGSLDVVGAVVDRISDPAIAGFVAGNVIDDRGASERLAQAFEALVPDGDRKRQVLTAAEEQVAQSPLGREETFEELWGRVEKMLTSYSDQKYISDEYGKELTGSRARAVDVEKTSDDPPELIATWVGTVSDAAIRDLDRQLLIDLLTIESDPARWRDIAETVVLHADDLARVGQIEEAWAMANRVAVACSGEDSPRRAYAAPVLERLGRGSLLRRAIKDLRTTTDVDYGRLRYMANMVGPSLIPPLAEALATEQDPRARRRIREILVGFGKRGRDAVQELLNASNWEVRRTAAYLLSEFGDGADVNALEPLLNDPEPRVQREALRTVVQSGNDKAYEIIARVLAKPGAARDALARELVTTKDERAAPLFSFLLTRIDRQALRPLFIAAIDALGSFGGTDAVAALNYALHQGEWWAPLQTRAHRRAAADALGRIGSGPALDALRDAAANAPRGVRSVARAQLRVMKS